MLQNDKNVTFSLTVNKVLPPKNTRGLFRSLSNTYEEPFLRKELMCKSPLLLWKIDPILDV